MNSSQLWFSNLYQISSIEFDSDLTISATSHLPRFLLQVKDTLYLSLMLEETPSTIF